MTQGARSLSCSSPCFRRVTLPPLLAGARGRKAVSGLSGSEGVPGVSPGCFLQEVRCCWRALRLSRGVTGVSRLRGVRDRISSETLQLQEPWTPTTAQTWAESVTRRTASGTSVEGNGWKPVSSRPTRKALAPPDVHSPLS